MRDVLLVRYGEVFLKGANRPYFLKVLTDNVKKAVKPIGGHVWMSDSRIYVSDFEDLQKRLLLSRLLPLPKRLDLPRFRVTL